MTTGLLLVAFLAITLMIGAIGFVVRELYGSRRDAIALRLGAGSLPWTEVPKLPALRPADRPPTFAPANRIDDWFERFVAGTGLGWRAEAVFLLTVASGLLCGGVPFLVWENPAIAVGAATVGVLCVLGILAWVRARRKRKMLEQLPDAISLLSRGVQAGESLEQALTRVTEHTAQPLADEFYRCCRQLDMGLSMEATMRALMRRVDILEVQLLASTLVVQRRAGGDLPEAMESLARVVRDRLNYQRQFRAATAAGRLSTILIALLGPAMVLAIWLLQTDYTTELWGSTIGRQMVAVAVVMYVIGLFLIFRILRPVY